jgi:lipid-A-disaccharide synthase
MSKHIMIIAGEASGDHHAARLVTALSERDYQFFGIGGAAMRRAGVEILLDNAELAVIGVVEVLKKFPTLWRALRLAQRTLSICRPDLLVLVDFQEFNLKVARHAHKLGIPTLFYIGPQLWAWRPKRVKKIAACIDHMAVILPFEVDFYRDAEVPATYVGHPLVGLYDSKPARDVARRELGIAGEETTLAFLPGSRMSEITRLLPIFLEVIARLPEEVHVVVSQAESLPPDASEHFEPLVERGVQIIQGKAQTLMVAANIIVSASGTAVLEAALFECPTIVVGKISPLTYALVKNMIITKFFSLPNIISGKAILPELIQDEATAENIMRELTPLFNVEARNAMRVELRAMRHILDSTPADDALDKLVIRMLGGDA